MLDYRDRLQRADLYASQNRVTRSSYAVDRPHWYAVAPSSWRPSGKAFLVNQSVEIIQLVYKSVHDIQDAICLGLTCKRLLALGLDHNHGLIVTFSAQWAGHRLICLGDYAQDDDLPPGVLSPEDELCLYEAETSLREFSEESLPKLDEGRRSALRAGNWEFLTGLSWVERAQYDAIVRIANFRGCDSELRESLLCNLTKREYVRQEAAEAHGQAGLGEFLLARICWSSDPSASMSYEGEIHRGVWAGDEFEVTTFDRLRGGSEGWKDVSDEMSREMEDMWESEYGEDWRKGR